MTTTTKTIDQVLLDQPDGIRAIVADLTNASSFTLRRCGSLSAIGNTEIGLACGPHAFQTIAIAYGDSAEQTLAARNPEDATGVAPMVKFVRESKNLPKSVVQATGILVGHGFRITAVNRLSTMTTVVLHIGEPATGIRAEMTWL